MKNIQHAVSLARHLLELRSMDKTRYETYASAYWRMVDNEARAIEDAALANRIATMAAGLDTDATIDEIVAMCIREWMREVVRGCTAF